LKANYRIDQNSMILNNFLTGEPKYTAGVVKVQR